ncbi:MAG: hypothetical protein ABSD73_08150 [Candidatus Bathyarchaeia archaeon]|jgi:hypothetical protein
MSFVRDALSWVDTGAVQYPTLHKKIIELTMPALVVKRLLPEFPIVAGRTATFVKENGSRSIGITEIAEGAEIMMDFTPLSTVTVTPYKKGARERISRENIEDLYIPVIEQQLRRLARRVAYQIDLDCMNVIAAAATYSSAGSGKTLSATGTEFTITGGLGSKDILAADAYIASKNFVADSLICNPIQARDLKYLPQFALASQYGEPVVQTGAIGNIYGLNLYVSNVCSAGTAYVVSTGQNLSSSYAPLGFFVIKRPLMSDLDPKKEFDSVDIELTTRYAPVVLNGECIAQITGLATT